MSLLSLIIEQSTVPCFITIPNSLGIISGSTRRKRGSFHFGVGIISGAVQRLFSFRADSILKSNWDFISNCELPDCVHFFGERSRQESSCANSRKEHRRDCSGCSPIRHNNTKHFLCPIRIELNWIFGNSLVRVGTQGLFRPYLKTFVPLFCRPDWLPLACPWLAPGSPRMALSWIFPAWNII